MFEFMLQLIILILPFRMITLIDLGNFSFKVVDAISVVIAIIIISQIIKKKIKYKFIKIDILVALYVGYSLANVFCGENRIVAFADLYRLIISVITYFEIKILIQNITFSKNKGLRLYKIIMYSSIPTIIYSFIVFIFKGIPEIQAFGANAINSFNVRFSGLYPDPNSYGIYLVMCIIILIELYKVKEISKKVFLYLGLSLMIALISTFSRSAIIMLGIYIIFIININGNGKKIQKDIFIYGLCVITALIIVNPFNIRTVLYERVSNTITMDTENDWAIKSRLIYYDIAFNAFSENPIVGVGRGNFYTYGIEHYEGLPSDANPQGLIFQIISELGIIGLLIMIAIIINIMFGISSTFKNNKNNVLITISIGILVTYLIGSLFGTFDSTRELWYILALTSSSVIYAQQEGLKCENIRSSDKV